MTSASSRHSPPPIDADFVNNDNVTDVDHLKNMSSTVEEIRDELEPNNANNDSERGGLVENMSNILEQVPDNGTKPNNAIENPVVPIEANLAKNMSNTLEQILDVFKGLTIAPERGIDDNSKFWQIYQKSSIGFRNSLVKQVNSDISIILTFGGLLSAVIATSIAGMQPNPGDTTNTLLVQLIQIAANSTNSVPDVSNLSSSTHYSSSTVLAQAFAYASLLFSLFAAFGAVFAKQWLNSCKTGRGMSLEERGIEIQMKLDGIEYFRMESIVQGFFGHLQISLLLFCVSLIVNMWAQQPNICIVIICITAIYILFYSGAILPLIWHPDSPFHAPRSRLLAAIFQSYFGASSRLPLYTYAKSSAVRWMLETSTNPESIDAAAAMVPRVPWPPNVDLSSTFLRLREIFEACHDRDELYVKYGKIMANLCIRSTKIRPELLSISQNAYNKFVETRSRFMRDAFMAGRADYDQLKNTQERDTQRKHRASVRTALRTMLVYGLYNRFSRPDDEDLVWHGDQRWHHSDEHEPSCGEFDWLVDYLATDAENLGDDETEGDALLVLSAMQGLGSPTKRQSYISSLIRCMRSTRSPRVRHSALRAVCEAREELASISSASMPQGINAQLIDELSRSLLTSVCPNDDQTTLNTGPDTFFHVDRDTCYIRILYALTKNNEWCQRLHNGHLKRCISLVDRYRHYRPSNAASCYLLVVFERIKALDKDLPFNPAEKKRRPLIEDAWNHAKDSMADLIDGIPALVKVTEPILTAFDDDVPRWWFRDLTTNVGWTLNRLTQKQAEYVNDGIAEAAIRSMKGLYDELSPIVKQLNTSQRDNLDGSSES
ncbi:hypothetical protein BDR04DRAFT_1090040 [Suillus decipiens]|nr:hypothetical protein BDR04DRAFT_1090040 [Suillus decipiens]